MLSFLLMLRKISHFPGRTKRILIMVLLLIRYMPVQKRINWNVSLVQKHRKLLPLTLKADPSKTYYWRVDALNVKNEVTTGTVWSFITQTLDAKEPVMYLSLDGTLKNFADVAGAKDAELVELEPTYVAGKNEQGLLLENVVTGSCISVPYYERMKFEGGSGTADPAASFSVSMWVKSDGSCPVDGKRILIP